MSNDFKVGYGKPPQSTQFKPGTSGNPAGRPKGTKNLRTDLSEELAEKITVTEGGQQLVISKQRAMLKSLMAKSIRGDTSASRALISLIVGIEQADAERSVVITTTAEDLEVLQAYKERVLDEIDAEEEDEA
jgi:hypothetical protein